MGQSMTTRKSVAIAFAVATAATGLATSAAEAQNFGGLHFGVSGGGVAGSQGQTGGLFIMPSSCSGQNLTFVTGKCLTIGDGSYRTGGAALGAGVGYDWQFDKVVVGLEADFSWVGARGNGWCGFPFALPHTCGGGITSLGTVRGKLGYEIGSIGVPLLAYVTGGFAFGGVKGWDGLLGGSGSATAAGWTIGGGIEALVAPNWSVKLEYLYTDLGNRGTFYALPPNMERLRTTANVIRVGLNYRFSAPAPKLVSAKY